MYNRDSDRGFGPRFTDAGFAGGRFIFHYNTLLFIVAYSFLLRKFSLKDYHDIHVISAILITIISMSLITLAFFKVLTRAVFSDTYYMWSCGVIYVVSVSSYLLMYFNSKNQSEIVELQVANKLLKADNQMLAVSEQAIIEMRAMRKRSPSGSGSF